MTGRRPHRRRHPSGTGVQVLTTRMADDFTPPSAALTPAAPSDDALPADVAQAVQKIPLCGHCGGRHVRACPRVRSMTFHPNGALASVAFWAEGKWSDEHVLWDEEITEGT